MKTLSKKVLLAVLVFVLGFAVIPLASVHAAPLADETTPPQGDNTRLEKAWARELAAYDRAVELLGRSDEFIGRTQELIKKAETKGWDASAVQTALNAFQDAIRDARPIINSANGIVTSHKGFDSNGKVTDRAQAIETVKDLGQHLKDARTTMSGTGKALRAAIREFRQAHRTPHNTP